MRHARSLGVVLVAGWLGSAGCIQNYYPATVGGPLVVPPYGSVCEVPSSSSGAIVAPSQGSPRTTVVGGAPPRVVVSQPNSGFTWRRSDSDSLATTRVEGTVDEPTLQR